MIVKITGTVLEKTDSFVVIDTISGVGYKVHTSVNTIQSINNDKVSLHIYHHIREDSQQLFGFLTSAERDGFITLTSVSGMGPKAAIKALSACTWQTLHHAICNANVSELTILPGIGKKLAERLITELRDKLSKNQSVNHSVSTSLSTEQQDLNLALRSLGYQTNEIKQAIKKAGSQLDNQALDQCIKLTLKYL